ncbi:hexitol phosphatase HxpB [Vibrio rarus]|uniref:hexitol phosphatase HxpB n=1 Tax=Vibrio rarus TaxID=413403 RepID=UPI0021C2A8B9|nr:hexitol phosphatase HxpB [Vibrio rarus]
MLKAIIFDMDGLMIDSEPYWRQAQLDIFPNYGIQLTLEDCIATTGVRIDNIVDMYYQQSPWQGVSQQQVADEICDRVIQLVSEHKPALPGLIPLLEQLTQLDIKLAVASSSPMKLINAALSALELTDTFDAVLSAESLPYGKPHPAVYINTAKALNLKPNECLAVEDSLPGLLAAKSATMKAIVVPEATHYLRDEWAIADKKCHSLADITPQMIAKLLQK